MLNLSNTSNNNSGGSGGNMPSNNNGSNMGNNAGIPGAVSASQAADQGVMDLLINYNEKFKNANNLKYRDTEIFNIISNLTTNKKSSVLITGVPGGGKTAIVEQIAKMIANKSAYTKALDDYIVYELPLTNLMAGTSYRGQLEEKTKGLIEYCENHKVILFIDEIHQLIGKDSSYEGVAQQLKPAMARGSIKIIGATTLQESKNLLDDPAFSRRFSKVNIPELTIDQTIDILNTIYIPEFTKFYNVAIGNVAGICVETAERIKTSYQHRPDNAITLLDRVCAATILKHNYKIETETDPAIKQVLEQTPVTITERSVEQYTAKENFTMPDQTVIDTVKFDIQYNDDFIDNIFDKIHKFIKRNELFDQKMLELKIAGEAHSGKTSLAKAIGKTLDEEPIYIDLKEYNTHESLTRLIGSEIGYVGSDSKRELIFDIVESNPRKVIILDNYDKMHPTIKNLFETSIKNQSLRYADNRTIDLSKTIFIIITEKTSKSSIGFIDNSETENDTIKKLSNDEMKEVVQKKLDKKIAELAITHPRFQNAKADITDEDITEDIDVNALIEEKIMSI